MYENNDQQNTKYEQKNPLLIFDSNTVDNFAKSCIINSEHDIQNNEETESAERKSFSSSVSDKLSSISQTFKKEKAGILYCLLAQFLWTTNSVYLKFLTQYFKEIFKNKTYLFARGFMVIIISYCLGKYKDGKIYKLSELSTQIIKLLLIRGNCNFFSMAIWVVSVRFLRISTCQILNCLAPIILIFLSIIFLGEKYNSRYTYGIILGIIGSSIIVLTINLIYFF